MNQDAVDDFKSFKNNPNTLFLQDVKSLLAQQAALESNRMSAEMPRIFYLSHNIL